MVKLIVVAKIGKKLVVFKSHWLQKFEGLPDNFSKNLIYVSGWKAILKLAIWPIIVDYEEPFWHN